MKLLEIAKRKFEESEVALEEALAAVEGVDEEISEEDLEGLNKALDEATAERTRAKTEVDRLTRIYAARDERIPVESDEDASEEIKVKVTAENDRTYRKDSDHSFFRDLMLSRKDPRAQERLSRHSEETRDVTSQGGGVGFIPPIWLAEEWAKLARPGRPFADAIAKMPMPPQGETVTVPKVSTGAAVASQNPENNAVQETDIVTTTVTSPLVTIAGQNDISRQSLERSYPGLDMVIFDDLRRAYDAEVDRQTITGLGSSGEHLGIRNVTGAIAVSYNAAAAGGTLLSKIYDASQQVYTNRFLPANLIVMHPRRAAWLAATQQTNVPILQQGGLTQAMGTQDQGYAGTIAGIPVLTDPNVPTNLGATTNADEVYVLHLGDMRLGEDELRQASFEEVLSGNLTVRLQLYAFSFFIPHRYAKSIAIISGTGLVAPVF